SWTCRLSAAHTPIALDPRDQAGLCSAPPVRFQELSSRFASEICNLCARISQPTHQGQLRSRERLKQHHVNVATEWMDAAVWKTTSVLCLRQLRSVGCRAKA